MDLLYNENIEDRTSRADYNIEREEFYVDFEWLLDVLSSVEKKVLKMKILENRSYEQIGIEIGKSVDTARRWYCKSIWRLRHSSRGRKFLSMYSDI